jgi:tetratricopeptide (TPR) repeat protein
MANLQSAEGDLEDALKSFRRAKSIRLQLGEDGIIGLALVSLGIGRTLALKGDYSQAREIYDVARDIIERKFGPKGHFVREYVRVTSCMLTRTSADTR